MAKQRTYAQHDDYRMKLAMNHLKDALHLLKSVGCKRTAARVRLAISSARGAQRHVETLRFYYENPNMQWR